MTNAVTNKQQVLELAQSRGIVSRSDLRDAELPVEYLARLEKEDALTALAPGIYMANEYSPGEFLDLAVIAKKVSHAVFFGISALQFHDLTTQIAHNVQIAIERGKWTPKSDWPPIEVFHLSDDAFSAGVETHTIENHIEIKVYSVAKTVADLFKFRNTFGLDVAIEALQEGWRYKKFTMGDVYEYAKICRVHRVMRPYLEMLQ
jgi:predicted transcriptional regulator of viral defense system